VITLLVFVSPELICTSSSGELVLNSIGSCITLLIVSVARKSDYLDYQSGASSFGN
jgi:hypothetical protein